jgi:hypothetical protein
MIASTYSERSSSAANTGVIRLIKILDKVNGPTIDGRAIATTSTSPSSGSGSAMVYLKLD